MIIITNLNKLSKSLNKLKIPINSIEISCTSIFNYFDSVLYKKKRKTSIYFINFLNLNGRQLFHICDQSKAGKVH